jgi:hypothetical protein
MPTIGKQGAHFKNLKDFRGMSLGIKLGRRKGLASFLIFGNMEL